MEQAGRIRLVQDGAALPTPFLDIADLVLAGGERGLLSMAFPPDYATSGRFYVYFTDAAGDIRIEEYRRSAIPTGPTGPRRRLVLRDRALLASRTTTAASSSSAPTATSTRAPATAAAATTSTTTPRTWARCSASCCGSIPT